jgi:hypothetical protein
MVSEIVNLTTAKSYFMGKLPSYVATKEWAKANDLLVTVMAIGLVALLISLVLIIVTKLTPETKLNYVNKVKNFTWKMVWKTLFTIYLGTVYGSFQLI